MPRARVNAEPNPCIPDVPVPHHAASGNCGGGDATYENDFPRPQTPQARIDHQKAGRSGLQNIYENIILNANTSWYKRPIVWIVIPFIVILIIVIAVIGVAVTHKHTGSTTTSEYSFTDCKLG